MKRTLSAAAAAIMTLTAFPLAGLSVSAEPYRPDLPAPDWVPSSFIEAMIFENTYGTTHIEGNVVCMVRQEDDNYRIETERHYEMQKDVDGGGPFVWENTYEFVPPEAPDENTATKEEMQAYEALCREIGWSNYAREAYEQEKLSVKYTVQAVLLDSVDTMDVTWKTTYLPQERFMGETTYSFACNTASGAVVETDLFGWLPDSTPEYYAFQKEYGEVSLHDNYLVYAGSVNYSAGQSLKIMQEGTGAVECIKKYSVDQFYIADRPVGGASRLVQVYQPKRPGTLVMQFVQKRAWVADDPYQLDGRQYAFDIDNDCNIKLIPEEASNWEFHKLIPYDCTGDGQLNIDDLVAMQKYLTGQGELVQWQNVDLDGNALIDAADYSLLKREYLRILALNGKPDYEITADLVLEPDWRGKGTGNTYTKFEVIADKDFLKEYTVKSMKLYDADGDKLLAEIEADTDTSWGCVFTENIPEECVKQYYAEAVAYSQDGAKHILRTETAEISFMLTPPPVAG